MNHQWSPFQQTEVANMHWVQRARSLSIMDRVTESRALVWETTFQTRGGDFHNEALLESRHLVYHFECKMETVTRFHPHSFSIMCSCYILRHPNILSMKPCSLMKPSVWCCSIATDFVLVVPKVDVVNHLPSLKISGIGQKFGWIWCMRGAYLNTEGHNIRKPREWFSRVDSL